MRSVLFFLLALVVSATALIEVQQNYHDTVGIPLTTKIKAKEDGLAIQRAIENRAVGGSLAPDGAQPYFGGLLINLFNTFNLSVCGSSLLSNTRAVTAAHCWFDGVRQARMFTVILDSNSFFTGGFRMATNLVIMHPQWNPWNFNNDIAIILLPVWVPTTARIHPISLPLASEVWESFSGHWALATGFGKTSDAQEFAATVLSHVSLQVISIDQCRCAFPHGYVVESTICTNGAGTVGNCQGDSGGPLVVHYNGREILIGVSSFGSTACQLGLPSAFARVTSFRNFIVQYL